MRYRMGEFERTNTRAFLVTGFIVAVLSLSAAGLLPWVGEGSALAHPAAVQGRVKVSRGIENRSRALSPAIDLNPAGGLPPAWGVGRLAACPPHGGSGGLPPAWAVRSQSPFDVDTALAAVDVNSPAKAACTGAVYDGKVGSFTDPLANVTVSLYGSNNARDPGALLAEATTAADGRFVLVTDRIYEYYHVVEKDLPRYRSTGALSEVGEVVDANWIRYTRQQTERACGPDYFFDQKDGSPATETPTATPTATATATPTPTATATAQSGGDTIPPEFGNFAPTGWITDTHQVEVSVQVREYGPVVSGLDPGSAEYSFTTDAHATWSPLLPSNAAFRAGSNRTETISATVNFGSDSEDLKREGESLHWVRFRIADLAGNVGLSDEFPVHIDTVPPEPRGFIYQSHTPGQWSSDPTVDVIWISALDESSGPAGYDVQWLQLTAQNPDCPGPQGGASFTPSITSTSPPLADGDDWFVCVWPRDNAGHWAKKPVMAGPYWIDSHPPAAVTNLHSRSHGVPRWTNQPTVEMAWSVPVGGADGYAYVWDHNPGTVPTTAMTTTITRVSTTLPTDHNTWYFHVAAFDRAGNLGPVAHYGPLGLDRTPPGAPVILAPPSGWVTATLTVRWAPQGVHPGSPIAGYSYEWGVSSIPPPDNLVDTLDTRATNASRFGHGNTVFLTVKSRDQAGNWGPYTVAGPYNVDAFAPDCRVTPVASDTLVPTLGGLHHISLRTAFDLDVTAESPTPRAPEWVEVQYSQSATGPWSAWLQQRSPGRYQFSGARQNTSYYFRCLAGDEAGNVALDSGIRTGVTVHVPDLRITRVEITQGIQNTANSVPLVQDKPTWVRVYIDDPGFPASGATAPVPNVIVTLYGLREDGTALPGSPLGPACTAPAMGCGLSRTIAGLRSKPEDSASTINFFLPPSWLQGNITLQAEVNPPTAAGNPRAIEETNYNNNLTPFQSHQFHYKFPLFIAPIWINYIRDPNNPQIPDGDAFMRIQSFARRIWPSPSIQQVVPQGPNTLDFAGDLTTGAGWSQLLNEVEQMRANASPGAFHYWYGLVAPIPNSAVQGQARLFGKVAVGIAETGGTMAHELAHNFGRRHAPCDANTDLDPNYPNSDASIGEFGFDPVTTQVYPPSSTKDLMSYCVPRWISPYTFEGLFAFTFPPSLLAARQPEDSSQPHVMVSGLIREDGQVAFNPLHRFDLPAGSDDAPGSGLYRIELQDNAGGLLRSRSFDLAHDLSAFSQTMPEPAGLARVVLFRGEQVLGRIVASASPPRVTLLAPSGSQSLSGAVTVRWTATDDDGDRLTYALQYSADGGETWGAIAHGLRETTHTVRMQDLAGSDRGPLQVVASDGFYSASDVSDEFLQVPDHAPHAGIAYPADGAMFGPEQMLVLQGVGMDKEDGDLAPELLVWTSDRDGRLGTGRDLAPHELSPGWHTITLTVTDSDDRQAGTAIRVYIGSMHHRYLPLLQVSSSTRHDIP